VGLAALKAVEDSVPVAAGGADAVESLTIGAVGEEAAASVEVSATDGDLESSGSGLRPEG